MTAGASALSLRPFANPNKARIGMRDYENLSACKRNHILLPLRVVFTTMGSNVIWIYIMLVPQFLLFGKSRDPVWTYPSPLSDLCLTDSFSTALQQRFHNFLGSREWALTVLSWRMVSRKIPCLVRTRHIAATMFWEGNGMTEGLFLRPIGVGYVIESRRAVPENGRATISRIPL